MTTTLLGKFALATGLVLAASASFAANLAAPKGFVARYEVLSDGSPMGEATLSLKAVGNGQYEYTSQSKGTAGVAAMLAANVNETSRFRWTNGAPEAVTYDYQMTASIKSKERHVKVDWATNKVSVDDGKKNFQYAAVPGMVERNILGLTLGIALQEGKQQISVPVAVKQAVETQAFKVAGKETVKVPAGSFNAVRMVRSDKDGAFTAWYVPGKYALPVKLAQSDGGDLVLQLVSYTAQ
jgi:hypothetical protein